jgi:hypothetical protein
LEVDIQVENLSQEDFSLGPFTQINAKARRSEEIMAKKVGILFKHKLQYQLSFHEKFDRFENNLS